VEGLESAAALAGKALAPEEKEAHSALAMLLATLRDAWEDLANSDDDDAFGDWLETASVLRRRMSKPRRAVYVESDFGAQVSLTAYL
jgi:hypothetical protein